MMVRWLPPKGGGAETPGRWANIGRTLNSASSWIWPMVFVIVGEEAFHLLRAHAAVGLGDVDDGRVEVREDVGLHAPGGDGAGQRQREGGDGDGVGAAEGEHDGVHGADLVTARPLQLT